jgi:predicted pyridoxine 5'-phosphate oxidase superfamily flavin-nucleotide-binding protein
MNLDKLPGSLGEHLLQQKQETSSRALAFYQKQMLPYLNPLMQEFIAEQEMVFIATADARGECDCSFRAGDRGFVRVIDPCTLVYPEYQGNGVFASLGNMVENPHIGLIFVDFFRDTVGLHVNGRAHILSLQKLRRCYALPPNFEESIEMSGGGQPELWVGVDIEEAFVHCSSHIPLLAKLDKEIAWGSDDRARIMGDYFHAKNGSQPVMDRLTNGVSAD